MSFQCRRNGASSNCHGHGHQTSDCICDGGKVAWPELMGATTAVAKATIMKDRHDPDLRFIVLVPNDGQPMRNEFCCNRVLLFVDGTGNVIQVPKLG